MDISTYSPLNNALIPVINIQDDPFSIEQFQLTSLPPIPQIPDVVIAGDINKDGGLDNNDSNIIFADRGKPITGLDDPRDIDKDGRITLRDVALLSRTIQANTDKLAPNLGLDLVNDVNGVTDDPLITGTIKDTNRITKFLAGFDGIPEANYFNIRGVIDVDGSFALDRGRLEEINRSVLSDGSKILRFLAKDEWNNIVRTSINFNLDTTAPQINIALSQDTGISNTDKITAIADISGQIIEVHSITSLKAGFDNTDLNDFVDITTQIQANKTFHLDNNILKLINGNLDLSQGEHTLKLIAVDEIGNTSAITNFTFNLDNIAPIQPNFALDPAFDAAPLGDSQTTFAQVVLYGQTEANVRVSLVGTNQVTTASTTGQFTFNDVGLVVGDNSLTLQATDLAGNLSSFTAQISRVTETNSDVVIDWNATLLNAIRTDATPPPRASRNMAMVHAAIFDAVNGITQEYQPYHVIDKGPLGASVEAAAAAAAHRVLVSLYPSQTDKFNAALGASLTAIENGANKTAGINYGERVGDAILLLRSQDGSNQVVQYTPGTNPGDWQPTPPSFSAPLYPHWGNITPFAITDVSQYLPDGPPLLNSPEYTTEYNLVRELGKIDSNSRTKEQTEIAKFWADGSGTFTPPGHWNLIAQQVATNSNTSLLESARLFALLNLALADAGIVSWNTKYTYNFWRPITAIRAGDTDGNPDTIGDNNWTPLLVTPPFPEYISGHSTFSGASGSILGHLFGNNVNFSTNSLGLPGVNRSFNSFSAAAAEAGISRIYGGIHFSSANEDGLATGKALGTYIFENFLLPQEGDTNPPVINAFLGNDTGSSNTDRITKDPTINGTVIDASAIASLRAKLDEGSYTDILATLENGSFTLNLATLQAINGGVVLGQGQHTLSLEATDEVGNTSAIFSYSFNLDTSAPNPPSIDLIASSDSGASATDNLTSDQTPTFSISGEVGSQVTLQVDGNIVAQGLANSNFTVPTLSDGNHQVTAILTDVAGNESQVSETLNIKIDTVNPNLVVTNPVNNGVLDSNARLQGTVTDLNEIASLTYKFNNLTPVIVSVGTGGNFDIALDITGLINGNYTLTVEATDKAGNQSISLVNVTVNLGPNDTSPPVINTFLSNDTGSSSSDRITKDSTIKGTVTDSSSISSFQVRLDNQTSFTEVLADLQANGSFTFNRDRLEAIFGQTLADGTHTLYLQARDSVGNTSSVSSFSFTLDTTIPNLFITSPSATGVYSSTVRLIGNSNDSGSGVDSLRYSLGNGNPVTIKLEQDSFDLSLGATGLTTGNYQVSAELLDLAGNLVQQTVNFAVSSTNFVIQPDGSSGWGVTSPESTFLSERDSFVVQTATTVELGQAQGSRLLQFSLDAVFDETSELRGDRVSVYLVNPNNPSSTLLDGGIPGSPLFTLTETGAEYIAGLVRFDGAIVSIDLTSLATASSGLLIFQLLNNDSDRQTVVEISDLSNTVNPEGEAGPVFPMQINALAPGGALNLAPLTPTTAVEAAIQHAYFDAQAKQYKALVSLRNTGDLIGRQVAVLFPDLPKGVSVANASGVTSNGTPYLNFRPAIDGGGLENGMITQQIELIINNPNQVQFSLEPEVLVGVPNRAPVLSPIPSPTLKPGEKRQIALQATDADGDRLTFSLEASTNLPNVSLKSDGTLTIEPTLEQIGTYQFTVIVSDGALTASQTINLNVIADTVTTTRISGVVQNTNQEPIAGIPIELGNISTLTAADGSFLIEVVGELSDDTLKIRGEAATGNLSYPFVAEKLPLLLGHEPYPGVNNMVGRPIYLPAIDIANAVTIDPTVNTTVTNPVLPGAKVFVAAGSLVDREGNLYDEAMSITEVPASLTPAALPPNLLPDLVVTIQPAEMVFNSPAPLTFPNRAGYEPGTILDLWSINPVTGLFDKVGTMRVSADGSVIETISGGIRNSSWHFPAPPPDDPEDPQDDDRNEDEGCEDCEGEGSGTSVFEYHSGAVKESHDLVSYKSLGVNRGLSLTYDSLRADPRPILHFGYQRVQTINNRRLVAELTISRGSFSYQVPGFAGGYGLDGGEHFWSIPAGGGEIDAALQADLRSQPSGRYDYNLNSGILLFNGNFFAGSTSSSQGKLIVVNSINSVFGSGWGLDGLYEIVENDDDSVLIINGDGSQLLFEPPLTAGAAYSSPRGDFSTLEKLADGTFRRTMTDQTVYNFNAQNKISTIVDSNQNTTTYTYDSAGNIRKITDAVGLETSFTYTGNRVTQITDPANRVTKLEYDAQGNLTKITDPDNTSRIWEYDSDRHIIAETDKRGNREETSYDFAGRVTGGLRKDGSTIQIAPVQVQGLYRPERTIDPLNPPVARALGAVESTYVDGNGNVTVSLLDQAGQVISARDATGRLPQVERNEQNLVTSSTNGRGNVTLFTYDSKGNLLQLQDELSGGSSTIGTISEPGEEDRFNFNGTAGQRLYYDALDNDFDSINVRLVSPTGTTVFSGNADSDRGLFNLPETGSYQIIFDGSGATTGDYRFQLLNLENQAPLVLNTTFNNTLEPAYSSQIYQFNGTNGQRLYFDSRSGGSGASWTLYGPNNQYLNGTSLTNDFEAVLTSDGVYALILNNNANPVPYSFRVTSFTNTTTALTLGSMIAGNITELGEQDTYTFTGTIGQRLYYDALDRDFDAINAQLISPSGSSVFSINSDSDNTTFFLSETGQYRLVLDGSGATTGDYSFRLLDIASAANLAFNTTVNSNLAPGLESDLYRLSGSAGQRLYFDSRAAGSGGSWSLYGLNNQYLGGNSLNGDFELTLEANGTYLLVVSGDSITGTIPYNFQVLTPETTTAALTLGSTISSNLSQPGEEDVYTFTGTSGQRLVFDNLINSNNNIYTSLISPSGATIFSRYYYYYGVEPLTLTETGQYRLIVDGSGETTGDYSFRLQDLATASNLNLDTLITGDLTPGLETDFYRFTGNSGQRLYFDNLSGGEGAYWRVYEENNQSLNYFYTGLNNDFALTLPRNGIYYLVLDGENTTANVAYSFQITTPDTTTTSLTLGSSITNSITEPGEQDVYTFSGSVGQRLYFDSLDNDLDNLSVQLFSPTGISIFDIGHSGDRTPFTLTESGTYRLVIDGNSGAIGDYSFRLLDTANAPNLNFATAINGTLTPGLESDIFTFTGSAGQRLNFASLSAVPTFTSFWNLYGPNNQTINGTWLNINFDAVLPGNGLYTLVLDGENSSTNVSYSFQVTSTLDAPVTNTGFGTVQNGNLAANQQQTFNFTASAGTRIYFDSLDSQSFLTATLRDANNNTVFSNGAYFDHGTYLVSRSGNYTLTLSNFSGFSYPYSFQLLDLAANSTALTLNNTVTDTLNPASEVNIYRFNGNVGQTLIYDSLSSGNVPNVSLISPSGANLSFSESNPFVLTEAGTYYVLIQGSTNGNTSHSFRFLDIATATNLSLDTLVNGDLTPGLETDIYRFTGTNDQRLYFDSRSGGANAYWRVYTPNNQYLNFNSLNSDFEVTLPQDGNYYLVLEGYGTSNSPYSFQVNSFTNSTTALTLGNTVTNDISVSGEQDTYTFTGTAGQRLIYDALDNDFDGINVRLVSPSGTNRLNQNSDSNRDPFTLTETGTYQLILDGSGATTGNYSFRLLDLATATNLSLDTLVNGDLTPGLETDIYRFTGTNGQRLYFDSRSGGANAYWRVYAPNNQYLNFNNLGSDFEVTLPQDGNYYLVLEGYGTSNSPYSFQVNSFTNSTTTLTVGNTITSDLTKPGETDTYTFTGTAGQRLIYDALDNDFDAINVRLVSPSGTNRLNQNSDSDSALLTLTETGTYQLILDGSGATTGNYSFRLLDLATATNLSLDTLVNGDLTPGLETDIYRFTGTNGQRLYFDSRTNSSNASWYLYNQNNQIINSASLGSDFEVTLTSEGVYHLVLFGNNATANVAYSFQVNSFTNSTTALTLGNTVTNDISVSGEQDTYTFTGTAGQRLIYDALDNDFDGINVRLVSPSGTNRLNQNSDSNSDPFTLTETGTYQLILDGSGATTGNYSFRLLDLATATNLSLDTLVNGDLTPGLETDIYRFTGTNGQRLYFDSRQAVSSASWYLYNQNNQRIASTSLGSDFEINLTSDGVYTLVIDGNNTGATVPYSFVVVTPEISTSILTLGTTVSSSISEAGETDTYTFNGAAGQQLLYDALDNDFDSINVQLISPNSISVFSQNSDSDAAPFTLAETGIYRLVVDGSSATTGDYSFRLINLASAANLNLNTLITGDLTPGLEIDTYRFNGTNGQRLYFDSRTNSSSGSWYLYSPSNQQLAGTSLSSDFEVTLSGDGNYTLVLYGSNASANINYSFQVNSFTNTTTALTIGNTVSGDISNPGEQDIYTFSGTAGQKLVFDSLDSDSDSINVRLVNPSGSNVFNIGHTSDRDPFTLSETGTYQLIFDGSSAATGDYSFRLLDGANAQNLTLNTLVSGDLTPGLEADIYSFNGSSGQRLYFDSRSAGSSASWYLYTPNNQQINGTSLTSDFEVTLSGNGNYILVVYGNNTTTNVAYSFQVNAFTNSSSALTLGNAITGDISVSGEQDTYTFTGTAGQRLVYDALENDSDSINTSLISPSGITVFNIGHNSDRAPFTLTESGEYRLILDGNGASTGDYNFRLLDGANATPLTLGTLVNSSLNPGFEADLYRFSGNAGQRLFFDSRSSVSGASWILYGPNNQNIDSRGLSSDFTVTLPGNGVYILYIDGANSGGAVNYSFQVDDQSDTPVTNSGFGTVQNGTLNASSSRTFNYTATAGTRVYFDSQSSASLSLELRDASNSLIFSGNSSSDNGSYLLGRSGNYTLTLRNTSAAAANYQFNLLDLGANSSSLTLGNSITNNLAASAMQVYRFTGTAGQRLYYDALDRDGENITVQLISGSGVSVISTNSENNNGPLTLTEDGSYYLLVRSNQNVATDFSFRILDVTSSPSLTFDTLITGDLTPGLETDIYRFNGSNGQRLYFDSRSAGTGASWILYGPNNQFIDSNNLTGDIERTLTGEGTYLLVLNGDNATANIPYSFQAVTPDVTTAALTLGSTITGNITEVGEQDIYTFSASAGQRLLFDSLDSDNDSINVQLISPNGSTVFNIGHTSDRDPFTLTETGQYRLLVDGNGASTGDYSFRLLDIAAATPLNLNTLVTDTLSPGLEAEIYRFNGSNGQRLYFDSRSGGSSASWYLYSPSNQNLGSSSLSSDFEVTLTNDEVYALVLYGNNTTANIPFSFQVNSFSNTTTALTLGSSITANLTNPGQQDTYTFTGNAGQRLYYDALDTDFDSINVQLISPNGNSVFSQNSDSNRQPFTLTETGTYRLVFDGSGVTIGDYSFRLLDLARASSLTLDTVVNGNLNPGSQTALYSFTGTNGLRLYLDALTTSLTNGSWRVFGPNNQVIDGTTLGFDFETTLTRDGVYILALEGSVTTPISYSFQVVTPDTNTNPINLAASGRSGRKYTYDPVFNRLTSMTDELGRQTLYEIDPNNGNTLSVTQVIGEVGGTDDLITRFTYTSQGLVDKITDPLGRITNNDYNALGRLTKITFAVGTVDEASQQFEYDRAGNQTAIIDENGHRTQFTYDALNRLTRITEADPDGNGPLTSPVTTYTYDAAGNLIKTTDPLNQNTQNQYDVMNRLIKTIDSLNQITTFSYDQAGNLSSVIDQLGHITQNRYDTRNRLVETVDPENGITKLTYDLDDNLTSVTDPVNNKTTFSYDARDRLTRETDSLNKATQYQYDAVNNLIVKVDRNNRRTEFEYDDINRLISETWVGTDQEINYSYDKVSNLTAVTDKYSSLSYTYDNRDRTLTVDNTGTPNAPHVVLSYTYDAVGNMLSTTDTINGVVSGTNNYSYDALNRLTKLIQGGNGVSDKRVDFAYNAIGQYTSVSRYADLSGTDLVNRSTYSYDVLNRLTNLAHSNGTNNVAFYNYIYDAASRITQIVDIDGVTDYTYDNRNQLTATDSSNAIKPDESYSYDANGNRTNTGYQTGANNRLTSDGIYNYEYDNEGNLIKQTEIATNEVREFQWDYHNRLVSVSDLNASGVATQSVAFTYDAFDRRIAKEVDTTPLDNNDGTVTHFVYNGDDVHLDFVSSGSQPVLEQRYLYRAGVDQILAQEDGSGNVAWMLTDHLGTVRDLVSETGNLANHLVYDSFGRLISESAPSVDTRYLYTGREFDEEIDLQYNRARYYDASTGRFISEDPIGFLSEDVNLYRYVFNKPSGFTDPQGTIAAPVAFGVGFVIGFGIGYYLIPPALDFYQNYKDMRDANWKNSDKYFHCKANCQAAQKGSVGSLVSEVISELREWSDEKIKGDPPEACNADRAANDYGREEGKKNPDKSCKDVCQQYRPNGLPAKY